MKVRGVVKGQTIELATPAGLPEGEQVEVEIRVAGEVEKTADAKARPAPSVSLTREEPVAKIASDPKFEEMRKAREFREMIAAKSGVYHGSIAVRMRVAREVGEDIAFDGWDTPEELEDKFITALQVAGEPLPERHGKPGLG